MRRFSRLAAAVWVSFALSAAARGDDVIRQSPDDEKPVSLLDGSVCDCDCDCEYCDNFKDKPKFLGIIASDHCFDRFISPLSNPFFFEDPRSLTEARGLYIYNETPAAIGGFNMQAGTAQVRARFTERFSLIAPRIGYWQSNNFLGPRGFMSAPVGFKYNLVRDVDRQFLLSAGMTYFIPGPAIAFANFGDGDFHFFLTAGKEIFSQGHWLSGTGFRIPSDSNWGTQFWYWSNQWDYELPGHIYPLIGLNWYHWMKNSGVGSSGNVAGLDLVDLPATGIAGNNAVTNVIGVKWKPSGHLEVGTGYEYTVTRYSDILTHRAYVDLILRY